MTVDDLKLSDSTKGFLNANDLTIPKLVAKRDDLTSIKGIGPARASEILRALEAAATTPVPSTLEPSPAPPQEEPPVPLAPEARETIPSVTPPELVIYTDPSGNRLNSRVAADLGGGVLNLQVFTRAGGSSRVEKVPYDGEGRRGSWKKAIVP